LRRFEKNSIYNLLDVLTNIHKKIKDEYKHGQTETAIDLLSNCQDAAVSIGNLIKNREGKNNPCIKHLEDYRNALYSTSQNIVSRNCTGKTFDKLRRQLYSVRQIMKKDIITKLEIVFFPYQLSMWDSFESIYLTAKSDPNCDAYCVPIPWFERNADGTIFAAHYDGDKYPSNIEVTDWREYDVAARHPDIIFIHNPYDDINYVTSVHPNYYTRILKDLTDLLVYISYGISFNILRDPQKYTDPNKRILTPIFFNCDVMLFHQHEQAERTEYILSTDPRCKNIQLRHPTKKRAVALGSPKFDKVISTNRENCTLPDDWITLIDDKAILLFCTSLASMLHPKNGGEKYLGKLQTTLKTLSNRDDIALWWRPHPLMGSTFRSMRKDFLENYLEIENEYKENKLGVFDDMPDLHRAIAWSDGLLTDKSSIMFMYLATGKPFSINAVDCALANPKHNSSTTFNEQLSQRLKNMKAAKGANNGKTAYCIWWDNFSEEDIVNNTHFDNFLDNFIHFITHTKEYPEAEEYRRLQLQIYEDFIVNSDGTAGYKIYDYCKKSALGG
jgi:hypothetical protein